MELRTRSKRPAVRWALIAGAVVVLVHAVAALTLVTLQRGQPNTLLAGVEVDEVDVGGLHPDLARDLVARHADERLAETVRITTVPAGSDQEAAEDGGDLDLPVGELDTHRAALGVTVDVDATLEAAWERGRRGLWQALIDQLRSRFGGTLGVELHLTVDDDHLDDRSRETADELSTAAQDGAIAFVTGADPSVAEVEVTRARHGIQVAPSVIADRVRDDAVAQQLGPIHLEVPAEVLAPSVTTADVEAVVPDAEVAVSAPVVLTNPSTNGQDLELAPAELAVVLVVDADLDLPEGERLRVVSSRERIADHLGDEGIDALNAVAVDATVSLAGGEVAVEPGAVGFDVDLDEVAGQVVELALLANERSAELAGEVTPPAVPTEAAQAVAADAEVLVSDAVVLTNPSAADDLQLTPEDLAVVLDVAVSVAGDGDAELEVSTSSEALLDHLGDDGMDALESGPVEVEVSAEDGELVVEGGTPGITVDADAAAESVVTLALQDGDRTAELPGEVTQPELTQADLEDAGITEIVSSFSTDLVPGEPRNANIQLAADMIDGDVIEPGETYSLNEGIGPRTSDRGFVENGFIEEGELISVTGGGVSQMGTTFMNAAWFAGIAIQEFHPHSLHFARYPDGREATLAWGSLDVVVENDSPHSIMILSEHSDSSVTVHFASTTWAEVDTWTGERTDVVPGEVRDGFTIEFGRDITYPDGSTTSESYTHTYQPE